MNARRAWAWLVSDFLPGALGKLTLGKLRYHVPQPKGRERTPETDYSMKVPFAYQANEKPPIRPIAIVCHLFHEDLADWILQILLKSELSADIFISTDTSDKYQVIERVFSEWIRGKTLVRITPNRGRDIAPKLIEFSDEYHRYEQILFIHSKKSPHYDFGQAWRDYLLNCLIGSPEIVASILQIFDESPEVGMVIPQHYAKLRERTSIEWGANFRRARRLAWKMDLDLSSEGYLDMPSGSMFWARPKAIQSLLGLGLKYENFPIEPCALDGTIAHCIERLFLFACEQAGYTWMKISSVEDQRPTTIRIENKFDVQNFVSLHRFNLLDSHEREA